MREPFLPLGDLWAQPGADRAPGVCWAWEMLCLFMFSESLNILSS